MLKLRGLPGWEARLSRLCAWVLMADRLGVDYGLRVGGRLLRLRRGRRTSGGAWRCWLYVDRALRLIEAGAGSRPGRRPTFFASPRK